MVTENIRQEFRLKNIGETRNYFLEEIKQKTLMSRKHKKICTICQTSNQLKSYTNKLLENFKNKKYALIDNIYGADLPDM